ncbi:hypothetical protein ACH42_12775 [Endozoicomonas sp. (ex Bugula neritina AB1)]|nr:hypothetical protein ACH42_12775 [Endozoicomonas sp. (ex Bugula neritina AB1)]
MQKLSAIMQRSPLWQRFRNGYEILEAKDRRTVQILSVAVVCAFIYFVIWEPVNRWAEEQEVDFQHQQDVNEWLQNNKKHAVELQKAKLGSVGQRELSSVVGGVARKMDVTLSRVQPNKKGLSVWVEDAAYQKFLKWLVILENQYNVQTQQIRIDKLKEEGRIKAHIHLSN